MRCSPAQGCGVKDGVCPLEDDGYHGKDHVILMDMGPADTVDPRVESLGKRFTVQKREVIIV